MITYILIALGGIFVVLLCIGLAIASFSGENYYRALQEARQYGNSRGITTMDFVSEINQNHFGERLALARCEEHCDHYGNGVVALSTSTMNSNSLASMSTIAHELGHARQDASGDTLKKHFNLRRRVRIVSHFFLPNVLIAIVFAVLFFFGVLEPIAWIYVSIGFAGLALFVFMYSLFLKYREIKIEKEASTFALDYLREYFSEKEVSVCKDFLDSARLTYWAVLFKSLLGWTFLTKRN